MSFDQRHLIALYSEGLITELPHELGAFPVTDIDKQVRQDLIDWSIVDPATNKLTPPAEEFLAGITNYEWAYSGLLLLYSERQPVTVELPEEFVQAGMQYAVRDIPRVGFLIGYRNQTLTTLVLAAGRITICADRVSHCEDPAAISQSVARIILNICDPQRQWNAYPLTKVSIPAAAATALRAGRPDTAEGVQAQVGAARKILREAEMARTTTNELAELLNCENNAAAQITHTLRTPKGKATAVYNAAGLMFFTSPTSQGTVVSYPTRGADGTGWITYEPGSEQALARGLDALRKALSAENVPIVMV